MKEALRALFASKKFQTLLIGLLITGGAKVGLDVSDELAAAMLGLVAILIGAQGATDFGKEAAKAKTGLVLLLALALGGAGLSAGCTAGKAKETGLRAATSYVDCMQPSAIKAALELKPTFSSLLTSATRLDGKIDWSPVRAAAGELKAPALRCAFATVVSEAMRAVTDAIDGGVQSAPLELDKADLSAGFDAIRTDFYSGERYKLEGGTL